VQLDYEIRDDDYYLFAAGELTSREIYFIDEPKLKRMINVSKREEFLKLLAEHPDPEGLNRAVRDNFLIFRATGRKGNHRVLFTGYFEPIYEASLS